MSEFNSRQLNIMIQKINKYKLHQLSLADLIFDLEALLNVLENDIAWKYEFRKYWADLEVINAMTSDDNPPPLSLNNENIYFINKSLENLIFLIEKKMKTET